MDADLSDGELTEKEKARVLSWGSRKITSRKVRPGVRKLYANGKQVKGSEYSTPDELDQVIKDPLTPLHGEEELRQARQILARARLSKKDPTS